MCSTDSGAAPLARMLSGGAPRPRAQGVSLRRLGAFGIDVAFCLVTMFVVSNIALPLFGIAAPASGAVTEAPAAGGSNRAARSSDAPAVDPNTAGGEVGDQSPLVGSPASVRQAGFVIWSVTAVLFLVPALAYFTIADAEGRRTIGKRATGLIVRRSGGAEVAIGVSLARSFLKLLPFALVHFFGFALVEDAEQFTQMQSTGITIGNGVGVAYLVATILSSGARGLHDVVMGTEVVRDGAAKPEVQGGES